jgi:hypothetical protein
MRHSEVSLLLDKQTLNMQVVEVLEATLKALKLPDPSAKRVIHD